MSLRYVRARPHERVLALRKSKAACILFCFPDRPMPAKVSLRLSILLMKEDMCGNRSKTVRGQKGRARCVLVARTKTRIEGRP